MRSTRRWLLIAAALWVGSMAVLSAQEQPAQPPPVAAEETEPTTVIVLEPSDDPQPPPVRIGRPRPDGAGRVPGGMVDFTLTDQLGRTVTRETLLGRPWVANFIFSTCPTHCPATLGQLYDLQRRLRSTDVKLVTITVDPATDTVARMAELSKAFGADPERWLFLTGDIGEIHKVIVDGFHQTMVANPMQLAHSLNLMHVDAAGAVIGKYRFHYQEGEDELNRLRQVLLGEIETPEANRFIPRIPEDEDPDAAAAAPDVGASDEADRPEVPAWVPRLRTTNALLNALATALLLAGLAAIKAGKVQVHKRLMLVAFATSAVFLACYIGYHGALKHFTGIGHKPYTGLAYLATSYRVLLGTHVVLAALVPVLALVTIIRGLNEQWEAHRRIAKITFPIWLYVSVTGVVIYFMNL